MIDATLMVAILDSLKDPIMFADTDHVIRYMNKAAVAHYEGGASLIGRSLLDCHNQGSQQRIVEILAALQAGKDEEEERPIAENDDGSEEKEEEKEHRVYMRAVRSTDGRVLGYYERYQPRRGEQGNPGTASD